MNEAKRIPVNRCLEQPQQPREQQIKEVLVKGKLRKRANNEIDLLLEQFHGRKGIDELLEAIRRRLPDYVLAVAMERVERRKDKLPPHRRAAFEAFKASLKPAE